MLVVNHVMVRHLRHRLGLTQEQLGQAIGQDQPYVSNVERGVRAVLTVATLDKLASALGVTMETLMTADERQRWAAQRLDGANAPEGIPGA